MIPKIIHYCWFGKHKKPKSVKRKIESWKRYCPGYKIIEWNEENFDINYCDYVKEAYHAGKWAFVTDVVRLYVLVHYGGIYMDADVEVIKPLDKFLIYSAFSGFQSVDSIPTGLIACEKNHEFFWELLHDYDKKHFIKKDGSYDITTNCEQITQICLKYGLRLDNTKQTIRGITLFPMDYFCAKDAVTGIIWKTENTYTIHHFAGSWTSRKNKLATWLHRLLIRMFGRKKADIIRKRINPDMK